jgi:hypothetical protein
MSVVGSTTNNNQVGNSKKRPDNSTKANHHKMRSSIGDSMAMKALIEFSDRYSNKNLKGGNPYTIEN